MNTCEKCGKQFVPPRLSKKAPGRYCSHACMYASLRYRGPGRAIAVTCQHCDKQFRAPQSAKRRFCSQKCLWAEWQHNKSPHWTGGRRKHMGYMIVALDNTEREAHKTHLKGNRYVYEHILIAERALGRCLKNDEIVHHINGDKLDNRKQNLLICSNSYHHALHARMSYRYQREHFGSAA